MKWIRTKIRLPEKMYTEIKMEAERKKKTVAAFILEKMMEGRKGRKLKDE